jgi:hypothetical protein
MWHEQKSSRIIDRQGRLSHYFNLINLKARIKVAEKAVSS